MFVKPRSAPVEKPSLVASSSGRAKNARYARLLPSTRKSSASRAGPSSSCSSWPVSVFGDTTSSLVRSVSRAHAPASDALRLACADGVVLRPPGPVEAVADVGAAVRDALRFPLAGQPLGALVSRGGRATILVELPSLPVPGSLGDPRRAAIAATMTELDRAGASLARQTLLVAGGLTRRLGHRDLELLVPPEFARRFHGRVEVHDVENPDLI